jgi:hypothetical protein
MVVSLTGAEGAAERPPERDYSGQKAVKRSFFMMKTGLNAMACVIILSSGLIGIVYARK